MEQTGLRRIFLIRHGESEGNIDLSKHRQIPDAAIHLTSNGKVQSFHAGQKFAQFIEAEKQKDPSISHQKWRLWYSPYKRTVQTKDAFLNALSNSEHIISDICQHPLLIEQDFGIFDGLTREERKAKAPEAFAKMQNYSEHNCWFFARPPQGESQFDVYCRVSRFNELILKQAENSINPIQNVIVIAHGATIRALAMDLLHEDVDYFEKVKNPNNASIQLIEPDETGGYTNRIIFEGFENKEKLISHQKEINPSNQKERS